MVKPSKRRQQHGIAEQTQKKAARTNPTRQTKEFNGIIPQMKGKVKMLNKALEKLESGLKGAKLSQHGKTVSTHVVEALKELCRQNGEFAQAVAQSDKTIADCVEAAVKGAGNYLSDIEVYSRAAGFWFEGAKVKFTMTIDLGDEGFSNVTADDARPEPPAKKGLSLSLDELLK